MTTYKLDQLEGGLVDLKSGRWPWYVIRLKIPSELDEVDDNAVTKFAANPDERSFRFNGERYEVYPSSDVSRERMWKVRR